jgi:hypothetical protein
LVSWDGDTLRTPVTAYAQTLAEILKRFNTSMRNIVILVTCLFKVHLAFCQDISLNELIFFQATKDPVKIDSILLTKEKWDCNCIRQFDDIKKNREWIYDVADSSKESIDKDNLELGDIGNGFSPITMYYTSDKAKAEVILSEMRKNLKEEKINTFSNDSIAARFSFFVGNDVAIETMIGENRKRSLSRFKFILMDKTDYLKGLTIK